jgi:hypothetical protein
MRLAADPQLKGILCGWLHQLDHPCPGVPYWTRRRANMTTLDTAPAEVLHAICALLPPKDVAGLRSTCNVLAQIGAHYLVRQVKFHTSGASLERLQKIANHEVFSQYVETVHFEANLLSNLCCTTAWRDYLQRRGSHGTQNSKLEMPREPQSPTTRNAKRVYVRDMRKWEKLADKMYHEYRSLYEAQQTLHQRGPELMADIMPRFPRLQKVIFAIGRCQHVLSSRFVKEFDTDLGYCAPLSIDTAPTAGQLKHVIAPGGRPLNLQTLMVCDLDPSLFQTIKTSTLMNGAFANLKKIDISFRLPDKDEPTTEPGLYEVFKKGYLRDALCSAEGLEELRVAFTDYTYDGPCVELKDIFGDKSFEKLKKLSLSYVEANTKDFIETLKHQKALKHLDVAFVSINGSWVDVLEQMRELDLRQADFSGFLSDDEQMYW